MTSERIARINFYVHKICSALLSIWQCKWNMWFSLCKAMIYHVNVNKSREVCSFAQYRKTYANIQCWLQGKRYELTAKIYFYLKLWETSDLRSDSHWSTELIFANVAINLTILFRPKYNCLISVHLKLLWRSIFRFNKHTGLQLLM